MFQSKLKSELHQISGSVEGFTVDGNYEVDGTSGTLAKVNATFFTEASSGGEGGGLMVGVLSHADGVVSLSVTNGADYNAVVPAMCSVMDSIKAEITSAANPA